MTDNTAAEPSGGLRGSLTTPKIVFLVVAAAAPMAAMVGILPLAFVLGTGAATPAAFAVCGLVLLCFSVGYAAMSRRITSAGGFYPYVARGLGRPPAVAAALVAVIAYNAVAVELVAGLGYFGQLVVQQQTGVNLPWELYAAFGVLAAALLGYRTIDIGARLLALLMIAEIGILLVLDVAVLAAKGSAALPATSFAPHTFLHGGGSVGIGLMFAFGAYVGFESAALYGEESKNPRRSVPLATYTSVLVITVFYGLTSWVAVGAIGAGQVRTVASRELGNLFFALSTQYVTPWVTTVMEVLLCTSILASLVAIHNAASRYMFALGRERILPGWLGASHRRHDSPSRASVVQTAVNVVVAGGFALAGLNPYLNLATAMAGLGTLGIVALQAAAAAAAVAFFRRRAEMHWWKTILAPAIGFAGLTVATVLLLMNYSSLTGTTNRAINALPWLLAASVLGGLGYALWLRRRRPATYAGLAADGQAGDAAPRPRTAPGQIRSDQPGSQLPDPDRAS
jgi:amino acid transporter